MLESSDLTAEEIARKAMKIAADLCVYTNHNVTIEVIESKPETTTNLPVLGYWPVRGRAAAIRYLFGYLGLEFKEEIYEQGPAPDFSKASWFDQKFNLGLDFPNLPYLIDGNVKLTESKAILKYIARKWDKKLLGRNEVEFGIAEMLSRVHDQIETTLATHAYQMGDSQDL
jgi:glutathione S-transferase